MFSSKIIALWSLVRWQLPVVLVLLQKQLLVAKLIVGSTGCPKQWSYPIYLFVDSMFDPWYIGPSVHLSFGSFIY